MVVSQNVKSTVFSGYTSLVMVQLGSGPQHMILVTSRLVWLSQLTMYSVHTEKAQLQTFKKDAKHETVEGEVEREGNAYDCHYILRSL